MSGCDLCGLPVGEQPIGGATGDAQYCCRGCHQVATTIDTLEAPDAPDHTAAEDTALEPPPGAAQAYFRVDGMHCTTCETFLRTRADAVDGVYSVEANYGLEAAKVTYDPERLEPDQLGERLNGHGYTFLSRESANETDAWRRRRTETEQRLIVGGFFTMLIMPWYFFSLYPLYLGFEAGILDLGRTTPVGIYFPLVVIGVMTTIVFGYTGYPLLRGAWISLRTREPNMDLLVTLAAGAAFVYSVLALAAGGTHLYFDVTVMVVMVVTLGRYYEGKLRSTATAELSSITSTRVNEAMRLTDDARERVPVDDLTPGDVVLVTPGEPVPLDGVVREGRADVDEAVLTGESLPVAKSPDDEVIGGATVLDNTITVEVAPGAESTLDRIATAMWEIQSSGSSAQRFADALATIFVPLVLVLGVAVTGWRILQGEPGSEALLWGLTILLVSCPCAMGLATPLAVSAGLRDALASGLVVTNQSVFEDVPDADHVVFDKTGTLTTGEMAVTGVFGHEDTLGLAATVERLATHPVADAIVTAATGPTMEPDGGARTDAVDARRGGKDAAVETFQQHPGAGVEAEVDGRLVVVGTPELVRRRVGPLRDGLEEQVRSIDAAGGMPVVVGWEGVGRGVIGVADRERPEWRSVVEAFGDRNVVVLTGDDSGAVTPFRDHPGVDHVFSGVPPDAKAATIRRLRSDGVTVMVGDGTNDAPALATADVGIALGGGTADACDAGDAVIVDEDLRTIPAVFDLADGSRRRIRENIAWALTYNMIALPLAVVGLINPFFAAVAMAASSIIVVTNSRRPVFQVER